MKRIFCFLLLLPLFVSAEDYPTQSIIDLYKSANQTEKMYAQQYVRGVVKGMQWTNIWSEHTVYCLPNKFILSDQVLVEIVKKHFSERKWLYSEEKDQFTLVALMAMRDMFPCKKN